MGIGYGTISVRHDIPHILLPFYIPGGKSAGDILVYAVVAHAEEQTGESRRRFESGATEKPCTKSAVLCMKERRPACRLEACGIAVPHGAVAE